MSVAACLRVFIFTGLLPLICGLYFAERSRHKEERFSWARAYVYGWIVVFATFELVCVPFVVKLQKFSSFVEIYNVCILVLAVLSAMLTLRLRGKARAEGKRSAAAAGGEAPAEDERAPKRIGEDERAPKRIGEDAKAPERAGKTENRRGRFAVTGLLWCLVIFFILLQMAYLYVNNHMDGDDSYYVAEAVITDFFDTMFQRDAYTGMPIGLDERHALSVTPVFVTWLGRMCGLHPTIVYHSILAPVFLLFMYLVYTLIGRALLKGYRHYVPLFLLLVNIWYVWGNVSIYTSETFMYTRTWQGKAMFANILIPLVFCLLYEMMRERRQIHWIMLFLLSLCGVFMTTASVYLLPMVYGFAGLWLLILEKKFRPFLYLLICCIPSLVYGGLYYYLLSLYRYV